MEPLERTLIDMATSELPNRASQAKEIVDAVARQERTTGGSGAVPNALKGDLLDLSDLQAKHPDKHLRWCNVNNPPGMANHAKKGRTRLAQSDGGRQMGNLAVFEMPIERYKQNAREDKQRRDAFLETAKRRDFDQEADAIARYLRDNHGIKINPERLISEHVRD